MNICVLPSTNTITAGRYLPSLPGGGAETCRGTGAPSGRQTSSQQLQSDAELHGLHVHHVPHSHIRCGKVHQDFSSCSSCSSFQSLTQREENRRRSVRRADFHTPERVPESTTNCLHVSFKEVRKSHTSAGMFAGSVSQTRVVCR